MQQVDQFKLGCLNNDLPDFLPANFAKWASTRVNDVFVLPLTNTRGEFRGLQFRSVDRGTSGYTDYFLDRKEPCLFGLGQAMAEIWRTRSIFLVEGAFDLFPVQRAFPACVATLTAFTTPQTTRMFRRILDTVWVGFDMDQAGRDGAEGFYKRYRSDFQVYIVTYPEVSGKFKKDPAELWEAWGDDQMIPYIQRTIANQNPLGDY